MPIVYLIRHPHTRVDLSRPAPEWDLDEAGEAELAALLDAPFWPSLAAVYASAECKAIRVAKGAADRYGLAWESLAGLGEVNRAAFTAPDRAAYETAIAALFAWPEVSVGGWESAGEAVRRFRRTLGEALARHAPGNSLAVVAHGLVLSLLPGRPAARGPVPGPLAGAGLRRGRRPGPEDPPPPERLSGRALCGPAFAGGAMSRLPIMLLGLGILCLIVGGALLAAPSPADAQADPLRARLDDLGVTPLEAPPAFPPAQIALGQALFFDKLLSGNRDTACATCHHPLLATGDARSLSLGTGHSGLGPLRETVPGRMFVARNASDLFNRGVSEWAVLFWDGRVLARGDGAYVTPAGEVLPDGLESVLADPGSGPGDGHGRDARPARRPRRLRRGKRAGPVRRHGLPRHLGRPAGADRGRARLRRLARLRPTRTYPPIRSASSTSPTRSARSRRTPSTSRTAPSSATCAGMTGRSRRTRGPGRTCSSGRRAAGAVTAGRC